MKISVLIFIASFLAFGIIVGIGIYNMNESDPSNAEGDNRFIIESEYRIITKEKLELSLINYFGCDFDESSNEYKVICSEGQGHSKKPFIIFSTDIVQDMEFLNFDYRFFGNCEDKKIMQRLLLM